MVNLTSFFYNICSTDFELKELLRFVVFMFELKSFLEVKGGNHMKHKAQIPVEKMMKDLLERNFEKYYKDCVHCSYLLLFVNQRKCFKSYFHMRALPEILTIKNSPHNTNTISNSAEYVFNFL